MAQELPSFLLDKALRVPDCSMASCSRLLAFAFRYAHFLPLDMTARANREFYWRYNDDRYGTATEFQRERAFPRRIRIRFRRGVWRPWFYYETEPFVYPRREEDFDIVAGVIARIETRLGAYE